MATSIKIAYPKTGTATAAHSLPEKFVAVGAKKSGERPVALLVSVDPTSHKPDGKVIISGHPIPYKKKDAATKKLVHDPEHWGFYFRVNGARPKQLFSLVVFDAKSFTDAGGDVTLSTVRSDFLVLDRHPQGKEEKPMKGGKPGYGTPGTGDEVPADQFVASVELPAGDYDIDLDNTHVYDANTTTVISSPDWSWPDGNGFCAAFFPTIQKSSYPALVDLTVVTLSSGDPQKMPGINVTAPGS
jgi:hypothetical protein